jgi:hypothetical protein
MTMQRLNDFISSGTNAERLAFTPTPATPPSGPNPSGLWLETDTDDTYCWNFSSSAWVKVNNAPTQTTPNAVTFNNSGSGAASGTNFDGSAAQTVSFNTIGAQPSDATLTALSAVAWSAGTQVLTLTAADTFELKTVGIAAGNILDKTAGDTLYQSIGSYQPLDSTLTDLAGLSYTSNALKVVRVNAGETGFELATIASGTTTNALTFSNTGGAAVGTTFDGSAAKTVDYSTVGALGKANNLSDLNSASTARTNLGLGTAATQASTAFCQTANNLSDLADAPTARGNLGLHAVTTQTGTAYTAVLADADSMVRFTNASAVTFTIPPNSSVAFPVGSFIEIVQSGAGAVSVAAGSGVTINSRSADLTLAGQYAVAFVKKVATDTWIMNGDL